MTRENPTMRCSLTVSVTLHRVLPQRAHVLEPFHPPPPPYQSSMIRHDAESSKSDDVPFDIGCLRVQPRRADFRGFVLTFTVMVRINGDFSTFSLSNTLMSTNECSSAVSRPSAFYYKNTSAATSLTRTLVSHLGMLRYPHTSSIKDRRAYL